MNLELINDLKKLSNVTVVAVSKTRSSDEIDAVADAGLTIFGENRVQEFVDKYNPKYTWHIIGHLQTNKVKYVVGKADVIESLDSIKLAKEIEKQASKLNVVQKVLVQIKISEDEKKTGLPYSQAVSFLKELENYPHICVKGFMCVASHTEDEVLIAKEFDQMHELYLSMKEIYPEIDTLSMGMSQDYQLAIAHGSNMVRIGHAIFE
jgi:pyridoxal phosphate enzyme (YggS family)